MIISLIAAAAENDVIGAHGELPWKLSADLKRFRELTTGHPVIMGRKTYESIGRPLPNRQNIVVTRQPDWTAEGVEVVHSLEEAVDSVAGSRLQVPGSPSYVPNSQFQIPNSSEVFIIGGGEMYKQALPSAQRIYLTRVEATVEGDAFFPALNSEEWTEVSREDHPADEKNQFAFTFFVYERAPR